MKLTLSHYILFLLCLVLPFSSGCARERCPGGLDRSVQQLRQNAERGCAEAQAILAQFYWYGAGIPQDYDKMFFWYSKSAEQGHHRGQHGLGICYRSGHGVPKDKAEAIKWWHKAAEQGNVASQFMLGQAYLHGDGVPRDDDEAEKWLRKAAEQGNTSAPRLLHRLLQRIERKTEDESTHPEEGETQNGNTAADS